MTLSVHAVDLHAWAASSDGDVLDDDERRRAERFATPELRRRFVAAHTALRIILGERLGTDPRAVTIARRPCVRCGELHGRPYVPDTELTFSLSHSAAVGLVATCEGREVGVDVEVPRPLRSPVGMARLFADDRELAALAVRGEPDRLRAFFGLWVRKEALVKATGEGIAGAKRHSFADGVPPGWGVAAVHVRDDLIAAVAVAGAGAGADDGLYDPVRATWFPMVDRRCKGRA